MTATCLSTTEIPVDRLDPEELKNLEVMQGIGAEAGYLLRGCEVKWLEPDEILLTAGQVNRAIYVVMSGSLTVHLDSEQSEAVARIEPGETVGELSVMDQRPASAYVIAAETSRLLVIGEATFWSLVSVSHDFAVNLMLTLADRLRMNNSEVSRNVRQCRSLEKAALFDALTGVHNRRWLDLTLPRLVQRQWFDDAPLALAMLDVDHFKKVNDTYGHQVGDSVLVSVAGVLRDRLRPTDLLARFGGEEFALMLPNTDLEGARCAAERLRSAIEGAVFVDAEGTRMQVTVSIGIAQLKRGGNEDTLMEAADKALYRAKENGRNRTES